MSECAEYADTMRGSARKTRTTRTTAVLAGAALLAPLGLLAVAGSASAADSGVWDRIAKCESGGDWHITEGLAPGDRVIVGGVSGAVPGQKVSVTPVNPAKLADARDAAAPAAQ